MCCIYNPGTNSVDRLQSIHIPYYLTYVITYYRFPYLFVSHEGALPYPVGWGISFHVPIITILPRREFYNIL